MRERFGIGLVIAFLSTALLVVGCTSADPLTRQDVLVSLTDDVIVPLFQSVSNEMNDLRDALNALCATPSSDTLNAAQIAWRDARAPWMRSQAMWFGPVMDRRSRSLVDWSPVDTERIDDMLAERNSISAKDVQEFLASTQRGLRAMEYILFADEETILNALDGGDAIRCQYLTALGDTAAMEMQGALNDWTGSNSADGSYASYFNGTAESSLIGRAAVAELVSTSVFLTRSITDMRLGKALGADGGQPEVEALHAGSGYNTVADMRNQVLGMRDVYMGSDGGPGLGVGALVRGVSEDADKRVSASFQNVIEALDELEEPLQDNVLNNPEAARKAHERLQEFQRVLNTEVVSLLGVSVGFADTDGDGG